MIILDTPPQLILPERPSFSQSFAPEEYDPVRIERNTRRAIVRDLVKQGDSLEDARRFVQAIAIPAGMFARNTPSYFTYIGAGTSSGTTSGSNTINIPSSAAIGDFAIYFDLIYAVGGTYTSALPTNWVELGAIAGTINSTPRGRIAAKILVSGEPNTTVNGNSLSSSSGAQRRSICLIFRPNRPIKTWGAKVAGAQTTISDPSAQTVSTANVTPAYIAFGFYGTTGASITTRTMTPSSTEVAGATAASYARYDIKNVGETPTDYSVDQGDNGSNLLMSCAVNFDDAKQLSAAQMKRMVTPGGDITATETADYLTLSGSTGLFRIPAFGNRNGLATTISMQVRGVSGSAGINFDYGDSIEADVSSQFVTGEWRTVTRSGTVTTTGSFVDVSFFGSRAFDIKNLYVY